MKVGLKKQRRQRRERCRVKHAETQARVFRPGSSVHVNSSSQEHSPGCLSWKLGEGNGQAGREDVVDYHRQALALAIRSEHQLLPVVSSSIKME